ncbi:MAG: hypothetical protein ACM3PE_07360 [Deltaproteobacteria bacterium]
MAGQKKSFLLRIDPNIYAALEKWADDEFRSVNAHVEYLLRESLKKTGRLGKPSIPAENPDKTGEK